MLLMVLLMWLVAIHSHIATLKHCRVLQVVDDYRYYCCSVFEVHVNVVITLESTQVCCCLQSDNILCEEYLLPYMCPVR